jgi:phage-related protein
MFAHLATAQGREILKQTSYSAAKKNIKEITFWSKSNICRGLMLVKQRNSLLLLKDFWNLKSLC